MAQLPRYESAGIAIADIPQLNFAGLRESFRTSQSLSAGLDRLSSFASKRAQESAIQQAAEYTVANPPTPEQLAQAKEGAFNPQDLVPGGGAVFEKAVKKLQGEQLKNVLYVETQNDYLQILNEVKDGKIVSDEELVLKLEAPKTGRSKTLAQLDPESAMSYNALVAANGFQIRKAANEQFELNFKLENDETTRQAVESGLPLIREIVKQYGTSNPAALKEQISAITNNIESVARSGTSAAKAHVKQLYDEMEGLAITALDKTQSDVVRLAASGNPKSELALSVALEEMSNYSDVMGISPSNREKYNLKTIEDFHVARLQADYDKAPNKQAFVNALQKDITKGPIGDLFDKAGNPIKQDRLSRGIDLPKLESLTNQFQADIRAQEAKVNTLRTELKGDITEANRILSLGSTVSQSEISSLAQRAQNLGIPAGDNLMRRINSLSTLNQDTIAFKKMSPIELKEAQFQLEKKTKDGATLEDAERLNNLRGYISNFNESITKDPVSAMSKSNVDVQTLNFGLPVKEFKLQVQDRVTQSKIFADRNGIKPKFLTNEEANSIATFIKEGNTEEQMAMIVKLTDSFGNNTPKVMAEVSKYAPEYAHIGGLAISTGNRNTVKDALNGIKQIQAGNVPFKVGGDDAIKRDTLADSLGGAFANSPQTRSNIKNVADAIYTQRAITQGLTSFDSKVYESAFQEASGAVKGADNKLYGGIIEYNNKQMPIPNNIAQKEFTSIIDKATIEDYQSSANGELSDTRGVKYNLKRLKNAYLAPINTDEYYVYADDYTRTENPQQFYTKDGNPLIVNFRTLANRVKSK